MSARQIRALFRPQDTHDYVPTLDIAVDQVRRGLKVSEQVDIHDHMALVQHATVLDERVRQLLAALDAQGVLPR
ncbi:hypothetical protein [Streptomyces aureocirculatus]|uniref:hypothetical protein n=1 Tax=Streptomyces aureocirculatus TaxID=67275 RepID=UPI0004C5D461|nr:hypothetical protein [Streptomyces aureocirculatus]